MNDKVKQNHQDKLGEEFGAVFHGLWNDWAWGFDENPGVQEVVQQRRGR